MHGYKVTSPQTFFGTNILSRILLNQKPDAICPVLVQFRALRCLKSGSERSPESFDIRVIPRTLVSGTGDPELGPELGPEQPRKPAPAPKRNSHLLLFHSSALAHLKTIPLIL